MTADSDIQITDLSDLRPGDKLVARRNGFTHYFGRFDGTAPESVWIIEGVGGLRKRVPLREYTLWRQPEAAGANCLGFRGVA